MKPARSVFLLASAVAVLLLPSLAGGANGDAAPVAYLGDDATCVSCHEEQALTGRDVHSRIRPFEVRGHTVGCEGCHGPGALHMEELDPEMIGRFAAGGLGDESCLECHTWKGLPEWHASTHASENVGCSDCHTIHIPGSALIAGNKLAGNGGAGNSYRPADACQTCHSDVTALFQLPSHHPVREGKMDCASCHDVHNSRQGMLKTPLRVNDLCTTCHQNKEGPFIFEHEPVQEDCQLCHTPHGAVANNLLTANEPALCLQCHEPHFHSGYRASDDDEVEVGGSGRENPFGARGMNIAFTTNCTQCHSKIHGSDLPSQTVPGQGGGLTQ